MKLTKLLTLFLILLIFGISILPGRAANAFHSKMVMGYYTVYYPGDTSSYTSLALYRSSINHISTLTYDVDRSGNVHGLVPSNALTLAAKTGIRPYVAVANRTNGSFDSNAAHVILSDPILRGKTVQNILSLIRHNGYKGVNIDFENMLASDRSYFNTFIRELTQVLRPKGYETVVSVMAKTSDSPSSPWEGTFDYYTLGQTADYIQLMTYDQNGPWSDPGPVSGLHWVENVLQYATSQIPANKVIMGISAYGYDWNTTAGTGSAVAWKNIPNLLRKTRAIPGWDATSSSPYFTYKATDGSSHIVWYENYESIQLKAQLAVKYNLAGVSMWCLRLEDENFWKAVQEGLGKTI
ncbi:glycosyl hydrolase family 18 protein [Brevibacillus ginsengisoli]|uniref:glycosyl hydrolase family 18 protein n=1 Tax=Brevibacillus ginsengisoli TaxID=363854 RepID=UPI003CEFB841